MDLFDKIERHYQLKMPFVVYNKPNENTIIGIFQKDDAIHFVENFDERGFVFANFDGTKNLLIPEEESEIFTEIFVFSEEEINDKKTSLEDANSKRNHENLVQLGIDTINKKAFSKVVLSRKESTEFQNFNLIKTFKNILNQYPTAFTYCFYHPISGLWLGAFSEQLLKINGNVFSTMALAGTQKLNDSENVIWQQKEQDEQQFVTDFIVNELENKIDNLKISKPYTVKAGQLLHLKTDITGTLMQKSSLKQIVQKLHPTPAVCGFPKKEAKQFILKNESYEREFYAGFLGELNKDFNSSENNTDLFVNLRCIKIENNTINFYAGGGITKDSIPEREWDETVNKTNTMKSCIL